MRPRSVSVGAAGLVALPLVVAAAALASRRWYPVLDLAMTELRVADAFGRNTPLIGLPGRIGTYPDQGSHPGPLSFYLLAPVYRLFGSSAWALEVAAVAVHVGAIVTAVWIAHRRAGWRGALAISALLAAVISGYGQLLLTQPWNPYLPLLAWVVVLLAAWAVVCGDMAMAIPLVVAASMCAQTHVPYLLPAAVMTIGALAFAVVSRRGEWRMVAIAAGIGAALWIPPLADQLVNRPGNIRKLLDHFGSPPDGEAVLGLVDGARLTLRHLDAWSGFVSQLFSGAGQLAGSGRFVAPAAEWRGAVTVVVWLAAAIVAWRVGSPALRALHAVVGVAIVLAVVSMARIFGLPWYYLTLWAWGICAFVVGAVVWSGLALWRRVAGRGEPGVDAHRGAGVDGCGGTGVAGRGGAGVDGCAGAGVVTSSDPRRGATGLAIVAGAFAVAVTASSVVAFADPEVPEERLSDAVAALAPDTYEAIIEGVGPATGAEGAYLVRWSDAADIGSPGFGLFVELERRGLDVRGHRFFYTPLTEHRVADERDPSVADRVEVHLATGGYVDRWRAHPDTVEVATYEPRSAAEIAVYGETRARVIDALVEGGFDDDTIEAVDTNLFGMSLDPRLPPDVLADVVVLLDLGQPMAVFLAPPGTDL